MIEKFNPSDFDKIYAGIDKDSNPGNVIPGDKTTYQDDTDSAPSLKLEVAEARKMTGTVFLDESTGGVGLVRQGDGEFKEGEKGIEGVKVTLTETKGTGLVYTATTNENGDFELKDYIPGDYKLTYTWGDETYTVQDYKGTIWTQKNKHEKEEKGNRKSQAQRGVANAAADNRNARKKLYALCYERNSFACAPGDRRF